MLTADDKSEFQNSLTSENSTTCMTDSSVLSLQSVRKQHHNIVLHAECRATAQGQAVNLRHSVTVVTYSI